MATFCDRVDSLVVESQLVLDVVDEPILRGIDLQDIVLEVFLGDFEDQGLEAVANDLEVTLSIGKNFKLSN